LRARDLLESWGAVALGAFLVLSACGGARAEAPRSEVAEGNDAAVAIREAVAASDRSPEDRALDAGRRPAEMLAFFGVRPRMRVAEIQAGNGYTAELLARVVGPAGKVYAQNNPFILAKYAEKPWSARLGKPVNQNIVRVDRELDDPLPPEAKELDLVIDVLFYHDTVWMKTDRARMNASIFAALKHGGVYVVVDHSGRAGSGLSEVQTLHRIEESVVREELASAGFRLVAEGNFLRNANDSRDWSASPSTAGERRGTSDRFALKFVKP
jgi:predicted methyltransferase